MDHDAGMTPKAARALQAFFTGGGHEQVVTVAHEAARRGRAADLPGDLPAALREALLAAGVRSLHGHQAAARDLLAAGHNVVVSTGTASGKSLCYQLAALETFTADPQARALFLFPTKALAQDQARKLNRFHVPGVVPAIYDGDTPQDQRPLLRRTATILLSNPDMLHVGILPGHERWAEFLHQLRYVVLDEAHVYRGVFGSHVAQVVRRLRRLCRQYGSDPRFVLTSATIANPQGVRGAPRRRAVRGDRRGPGAAPGTHDRPLEPAARGRCHGRAPQRPRGGELRHRRVRAGRLSRDRVRADAQGGGARVRPRPPPPRGPRRPRRGRTRAAVPRRLHAGAAARHRAAPVRPRARRRRRHAGARAGHRRRQPGRLARHRLPRHDHQPAPALGQGRPVRARLRRAGGRPGRARPVLHARAGPPPGTQRRGGDHRPAQPAHQRPAPGGRRLRASADRRRRGLLRRAGAAAGRAARPGRPAAAAQGRPGLVQAVLPRRRRRPAHREQRAVRHRRGAPGGGHRHRRARARLPLLPSRRRVPAPGAELPRPAPRPRDAYRHDRRLRRQLLHPGQDRQERARSPGRPTRASCRARPSSPATWRSRSRSSPTSAAT